MGVALFHIILFFRGKVNFQRVGKYYSGVPAVKLPSGRTIFILQEYAAFSIGIDYLPNHSATLVADKA